MTACTSSWAVSIRRPVGSPRASRTTMPPCGSRVSRVMPAAARAAELAHVAWPSIRVRATGWRGAAASSDALPGKARPGQGF